MSQGNNFLTLPTQEGLFKTVRNERSAEEGHRNSPADDEDDEETEEDVRLIPRSSPVPRKRGHSIADETAEYMRIRLALTRRVSFADAAGGELADVREFVAFDSDDEDISGWEEEEERYRSSYRLPIFSLSPEFEPLRGADLTLAVHTNKVEVESVSTVPDEPLAFSGLIRVLNISFQKEVFVRSTMDGWITHFDYPADYVEGSNDGETDTFSFKLSFASPYLFNGARIDFVVRYETPSGDFWANNFGRNYSVTLIQSYEDDTPQACKIPAAHLKSILKPPRFGTDTEYDDSDDKEKEEETAEASGSSVQRPSATPANDQPEIDIETKRDTSIQNVTAQCALSNVDETIGEHPLSMPTTDTTQIDQSETVCQASQPPLLSKPQQEETTTWPAYGPAHPADTRDVLEDYFEDSVKPKQSLQADKDDLQISTKVPSHLDLAKSVALPVHLHLEDKIGVSEENQEERQYGGIQSQTEEEVNEAVQRKSNEKKNGKEDKSSLHAPVELTDPREEMKTGDSEEIKEDLEQKEEENTQAYGSDRIQEEEIGKLKTIRMETMKKVEPVHDISSSKADGEEMPSIVASSKWQAPGVTPLGPIEEGIVNKREPILSATTAFHSELLPMPHQCPLEVAATLPEDSVEDQEPLDATKCKTISEENLVKTDISETKARSPHLITSDRPIPPVEPSDSPCGSEDSARVFTEDDLVTNEEAESACVYLEPTYVPHHKVPGQELSLPCKTSQTPEAHVSHSEENLEKTLLLSVAFLLFAICLVIGLQNPRFFIFMGLFLVSLCF